MKNNMSWESFSFKDISVLDNLSWLWILKDEEVGGFILFWRFSANFSSLSYSFTLSKFVTLRFPSTGFPFPIFCYSQCLSFIHNFSIFLNFDALFYCEIDFFSKIHGYYVAWVLRAKKNCLSWFLYLKDNLRHTQFAFKTAFLSFALETPRLPPPPLYVFRLILWFLQFPFSLDILCLDIAVNRF